MLEEFNFSSDFQDLVLACLVRHYDRFSSHGEIIKPEYFWGPIAAQTCEALQTYQKKYNRFPGFEALGNFMFDRTKGEGEREANAALEYVQKLAKIDTLDWQYVLDRCSHFARERALNNAIQAAHTALSEGKIPEEGFAPMFSEAMKVGQDMSDLGYVMTQDSDAVIDKITDITYGVKTGWPALDAHWPNGWAPGWLAVPLAPPKRYKTTFCVNLAMNVIKNDPLHNVFFYACEISSELMLARAYANLTGKTLRMMYDDKEDFKKATREVMDEQILAHLIAKHYPAKTASILDIRNHALRARDAFGIEPKMIVIDHAETIKPKTASKGSRQSDWREQADIYTEARALGDELKCVVVMPDRCNKETVDRPVPNMKSFQGAFEKAGIVDIGFGLCATEKEIQDGIMRYFLFLNRHGEQYVQFRGQLDPPKVMMTIDEQIAYDPEQAEAAAPGAEYAAREERRQARGDRPRRRVLDMPRDLQDPEQER
jgi:hypothetical protein